MVYIRYLFILLTFLIVLSGCQSNLGYVVKDNILDQPENIEAMNEFIKKVEKKEKAKVTVLSNGIEGQETVDILTFNGKEINVNRTVEEEFIEEYQCNSIESLKEDEGVQYTLLECDGENFYSVMDIPILFAKE